MKIRNIEFVMPRFIFIIFIYLIFTVNTAHAELLIDSAKYINLYRKHFDRMIAADLYASPAENQAARRLREQILDYLNNQDYKITPELSEKNWTEYREKEFKTEEAFKLKLKNSYLEEKQVKNKFIQNQYFNYYFQTVISKRIEEDINNRYKILEFSKKQNIEVKDTEIEEKLLQMIQNWGGEAHFDSFMKSNNLSSQEIVFFIRTDLAREAIISKVLSSDLEKNSEFSSSLKSAIYNHFQNFNATQNPDYYFTQVFIAKEVPEAKTKIEAMHKACTTAKTIVSVTDPAITVTKLQAPVSLNSDLYLAPIKDTVLKLGNNELLVNNALSPIVETNYGYHFFQLVEIEIPESLSYDQAKTIIYQKINTQKSRDFNSLFAELLQ